LQPLWLHLCGFLFKCFRICLFKENLLEKVFSHSLLSHLYTFFAIFNIIIIAFFTKIIHFFFIIVSIPTLGVLGFWGL